VSTIRWTTDGSDPKVDHGNEYTRAIPLTGLTHLKVRAFDKAGNPSTLAALTVTSLAGRLLVGAPASVVVTAKVGYVRVKLSSTRRALVTAMMSGTGLKKPLRWNFVLSPGTSLVQLRLPKTIRRPGTYRVVWKLSADTRRAQKTTRVTVRR
jgi:Fn3 associated